MNKILAIVVIILFIILAAIADPCVTTATGAACMFVWAHCQRRSGFDGSWTYQPPMLGVGEMPRDAPSAAAAPEAGDIELGDDGGNLRPEVLQHNSDMLRDIMYPPTATTDDRAADLALVGGAKAKKSLDIRSHWNNHNWKKYYDYELGTHDSREWWGDNEFEHGKLHTLI